MLTEVTNARASVGSIKATPELINDPEAFQKFIQAQNQLQGALSRLLVVSENYPQLKSDALFRDLQSQLEGTENRITVARNRYIKSVQEYNTTVRQFPTNLTAMIFKMGVKPNFTVADEAAVSTPPKVDFGKPAPAAGCPPHLRCRPRHLPRPRPSESASSESDAAAPVRAAARVRDVPFAANRDATSIVATDRARPHCGPAAMLLALLLSVFATTARRSRMEGRHRRPRADSDADGARHRSHADACRRPKRRRSKRSSPTGKQRTGNQLVVLIVPSTAAGDRSKRIRSASPTRGRSGTRARTTARSS